MRFRILSRFVLSLTLLVTALNLTPAQALGADDAKVIWCPAKVLLPRSNKDGCTPALDTMGLLLTALASLNPATAGTVWIGKNYDSSAVVDGKVVFDGATLTKMAKYPLNIKGGWNGLKTGTVDLKTFSTFDGASFTVQNWRGSVTVRNLKIRKAVTDADCHPLTNSDRYAALCIATLGNIKLDRVQSQGAFLTDIRPSADSPIIFPSLLSVTNSQFSESSGDGLGIWSSAPITLANVCARDNAKIGVVVDSGATFGKVSLSGTNAFVHNGLEGLKVVTMGSVTATNLIAYDNGNSVIPGASGVYVDNGHNGGLPNPSASPVAITGSAKLKGNGTNGLEILTRGPITAKNVTATGNGADGLWFQSFAPADTLAISLSNANADQNTLSGIVLFADGKLSLNCSGAYKNLTNVGLYVRAADQSSSAAALQLQGFWAYSNGAQDLNYNTTAPLVESPICP